MTYVFDVSSEHNDLWEVESFVLYEGYGDYRDCNRRDEAGHMIYNVEFRDKRYALQFKLRFNATLLKWDESDNETIVTIEDLVERGYEEIKLDIPSDRVGEFLDWCQARDFPIVDEIKFIRDNKEPMTVWVPGDQLVLVKLTWG